jgi:putative sterol carrier protein
MFYDTGTVMCSNFYYKTRFRFTLSTADFGKMFSGKLKPTTAFMTGKLKIEGNMGKAMALEKLMGKMQKRSFSTFVQNTRDTGNLMFLGQCF